ncbi:hypothetical protein Hdeb2414_s0013g00408221 [Helianthus debilis subsp. tardiflorus]
MRSTSVRVNNFGSGQLLSQRIRVWSNPVKGGQSWLIWSTFNFGSSRVRFRVNSAYGSTQPGQTRSTQSNGSMFRHAQTRNIVERTLASHVLETTSQSHI